MKVLLSSGVTESPSTTVTPNLYHWQWRTGRRYRHQFSSPTPYGTFWMEDDFLSPQPPPTWNWWYSDSVSPLGHPSASSRNPCTRTTFGPGEQPQNPGTMQEAVQFSGAYINGFRNMIPVCFTRSMATYRPVMVVSALRNRAIRKSLYGYLHTGLNTDPTVGMMWCTKA